ncbi:MAG TPA: hypothetical protein VNG53_06265 [Bacteroidia bacterium]|nr:hypothetical protein [Bacteroidia bacterium]
MKIKIVLILIVLIGLFISKIDSKIFVLNKKYFSAQIDEQKYEDSIADIKINDDNLGDTILKPLRLITTKDSIIVKYDFSSRVYFVIGFRELRRICVKDTSQWEPEGFKKVLKILDKKSKHKKDTILVKKMDYNFDEIVAYLLRRGLVKIYDKQNKIYVDTVYSRIERYGSTASRFYYFKDGRTFYSDLVLIGIIDNQSPLVPGPMTHKIHYLEYEKEAEKLREIGQ